MTLMPEVIDVPQWVRHEQQKEQRRQRLARKEFDRTQRRQRLAHKAQQKGDRRG